MRDRSSGEPKIKRHVGVDNLCGTELLFSSLLFHFLLFLVMRTDYVGYGIYTGGGYDIPQLEETSEQLGSIRDLSP